MMTKISLTSAAAALALFSFTEAASANLVTAGSSPFTLHDTVLASTSGFVADLLTSVTLSNFSFGATSFSMTVQITNNTNAALFPSGRITGFGFNVTPDATSVSDNSGVFNSFLNDTFPSFKTVDICTSTGNNNCAGGGGGDLAPGASSSFTLTLAGLPTGTTSIDLGANTLGNPEVFFFKYQTGQGSIESSCTYGSTCDPTTTVPEPVSLLLLGTGLLGLGAVARRKSLI